MGIEEAKVVDVPDVQLFAASIRRPTQNKVEKFPSSHKSIKYFQLFSDEWGKFTEKSNSLGTQKFSEIGL